MDDLQIRGNFLPEGEEKKDVETSNKRLLIV